MFEGLSSIFKFDSSQPRAPAGTGNGGQWIKTISHAALSSATPKGKKAPANSDEPRSVEEILSTWQQKSQWDLYQKAARNIIGDHTHDQWLATNSLTVVQAVTAGMLGRLSAKDIRPDDVTPRIRAEAKLLLDAIEKAPEHDQIMYRGLYASDFVKSLKVGDTYSESLGAWSLDKGIAEKFAANHYATAEPKSGGKSAVVVLHNPKTKGLDVSQYAPEGSIFRNAKEWLSSGEYRVTKIEKGSVETSDYEKVVHPAVIHVERLGPAKAENIQKSETTPEGFSHVFKFNPNHDQKGRFAVSGVPHSVKDPAELEQILRVMAGRDGHPNIMDLEVGGTKPFGGLGDKISRQRMPQIPTKRRQEFLDSLHVNVVQESVDPMTLKPTQDQLDGQKIGQFFEKMVDPNSKFHEHEPILVSKDNYIIDGHHHWGTYVAYNLIRGPKKIPAYVVHMDQKTLLKKAQEFTDAHGIERKTIGKGDFAHVFKFNANHEPAGSAKGGQFAKASGSASSGDVAPSLKPVRVAVPKEISDAIEKVASDMGGVKDQNGAAKITAYLNEHYNKELQDMMDSVHTDHRPTIMLHEGDLEKGIPTIWLLGWSNREGTDIHDHVGSSAAITVVRGRVDERAFAFKTTDGVEEVKQSKTKDGLDVASTLRSLHSGSTVTIGAPYVHEMHGESGNLKQRDITVHGYYPPLDKMHYFVHHKNSQNLFYDGMWDEHGNPDTKVRKGHYVCGCGYSNVFKFNANHVPAGSSAGGQFAKAHGEGSATNSNDISVSDYYKARDKNVTENDILSKFSKDDQREISYAIAKAESSPTSVALYTHDGVYTEERQKLHQAIIDSYVKEVAHAMPGPDEKPTFIVLAGRGGSGKSSFTNGIIKEFDASKFIRIDSDEIKAKLRPPYEGWNAASVHAEASELVETMKSVLLAKGANVILDGTMKSLSMESNLRQAKASGYRIEGHYMYVSREEAAIRSTKRYLGKDPQHRGRLVPVDVILGNTKNEANFDHLKKYFDSWSAYDNSGKSPVLIGKG